MLLKLPAYDRYYFGKMLENTITRCELPEEIDFEALSTPMRIIRNVLINPIANFLPAGISKALLKFGKSQLAEANWTEPGGWKSMVISYNGQCKQIADRILVKAGTVPKALRNRKRLVIWILSKLINQGHLKYPHILCLGAGPGLTVIEAISQARLPVRATLVDLNDEPFEHGMRIAKQYGVHNRVRFIKADVREIEKYLHEPPGIVEMIGLCEYLQDDQIAMIVRAVAQLMPLDASIIFNSVYPSHGVDRFLRRVFGLRMIYRSTERLCQLMQQAGFGEFQAYAEPMNVYEVCIGKKINTDNNLREDYLAEAVEVG